MVYIITYSSYFSKREVSTDPILRSMTVSFSVAYVTSGSDNAGTTPNQKSLRPKLVRAPVSLEGMYCKSVTVNMIA